MSKITELQAAQNRYEEAMAKLEEPSSVSINLMSSLKKDMWGYVQFIPETGLLEIRIQGHPAIDLELNQGQQASG